MANILMLVTQFATRGSPPDPPRQLADAFVSLGHKVKVIVIPWQQIQDGVERYSEHDRLEILRIPPLKIRKLGRLVSLSVRWAFSSWGAKRHAKKFVGKAPIDLVYATSPAVTMAFLIRWALRFSAHSYLYIVDFFPFHQRAIGLIPDGPIFGLAERVESSLIRQFDVVACMSARNVDYLHDHYVLAPGQRVTILPLSTGIQPERSLDVSTVRARYGLSEDKIVAIFGGQITEGRGIEELLEAACQAETTVPELHFVLVGSGRLVHLVESYIATGRVNVTLIPSLERDTYLDLAAACDIGLVVTVPIADIPTFPSKTLDYLQAGLPIVAAVESATDFREFVEESGFGLVVTAGETKAFLNALVTLINDPKLRCNMASVGRKTLREVFDVNRAARKILDHTLGKG